MDGGQARDGFSFGGLERGKPSGMMVHNTAFSEFNTWIKNKPFVH